MSSNYKIGVSEEDGIFLVEVEDGTQVVFHDGTDGARAGITLRFPTEKLLKMFEKQLNNADKNPEHLAVTFSAEEFQCIKQGVRKCKERMYGGKK